MSAFILKVYALVSRFSGVFFGLNTQIDEFIFDKFMTQRQNINSASGWGLI